MRAAEKREIAEKCLELALKGDFKKAAKIRQKAYLSDSVETTDILRWSNWHKVWLKDQEFWLYLNAEDYSDMQNTPKRIDSLKAGIFIDYLFDFRDKWGVNRQAGLSSEKFSCPLLDSFLRLQGFNFVSINREFVYADTRYANANTKIYYSSLLNTGIKAEWNPPIYERGEYNLGFSPSTSAYVIEGRRKYYEEWDQFLKLSELPIEKFPKTFKTFQKHKLNNSDKYKDWLEQAQQIESK